jgi:hypothetical protein
VLVAGDALAALGPEIARFGHGAPVSQDTAAHLAELAARLSPAA